MSLMCAYQNCLCVKYPCSRTAFFSLPTDGRREIWIRNSGNKSLSNINAKAQRFFCEQHFRQCDIRSQFNRKILRKEAVPIEYNPNGFSITLESEKKPKPARRNGLHKTQHKTVEVDDDDKRIEANLVIEKIGDTTQFYEDAEMSDLESQCNDNTTDDDIHLENTYTLLDFCQPSGQSEDSEEFDQNPSPEDNTEDNSTENNYDETNAQPADSSILEIKSLEPVTIMQKSKPTAVELLDTTTHNDNAQITTSNNDYEEDKHFALSLVGYFQRLPNGKKSLAKLKILQYLTELDIGLTGNL